MQDLLAMEADFSSEEAYFHDVIQGLKKLDEKSWKGIDYMQLVCKSEETMAHLQRVLSHPKFYFYLDRFINDYLGYLEYHPEEIRIRENFENLKYRVLNNSFSPYVDDNLDVLSEFQIETLW